MNKYKLTITVEAENAVTGCGIAREQAEIEGDVMVLFNMRYDAILHRLLDKVLRAIKHHNIYD